MFEVRKLYFYLISFISLLIILFSAQNLISTVLQNYVFKTNNQFTYQPPFISAFFGYNYSSVYPPYRDPYVQDQEKTSEEIIASLQDNEALTDEQKQALDNWMADYNRWKKDQEDYQRNIINNLIGNITALLIFTPAFWFHFKLARKSD